MDDSQDFETDTMKRQKLSVQLNKQPKKALSPSSHFNTTVSNVEIQRLHPKNTSCNTSWAVHIFTQWIEQRNKCTEITYSNDLLEKAYNPIIIFDCLQWFVSEVRRANGTNYPPKTIYQIRCGLLCYSRENQSDPVNFLDRRDTWFKKLHATCDMIFLTLHEGGIGV